MRRMMRIQPVLFLPGPLFRNNALKQTVSHEWAALWCHKGHRHLCQAYENASESCKAWALNMGCWGFICYWFAFKAGESRVKNNDWKMSVNVFNQLSNNPAKNNRRRSEWNVKHGPAFDVSIKRWHIHLIWCDYIAGRSWRHRSCNVVLHRACKRERNCVHK